MKLKKLLELRAEKANAMSVILEKAKVEERAISAEETVAFDKLDAEIKSIDDTIRAEQRAEEISMFNAKKEQTQQTQEQIEERAFANFVIDNQIELRAGEIQLTQGNNGSIVPTTIANRIIKSVRDMCPFLEISDVVYTNGKLSVPVYGEDSTNYIDADYIDEGVDLTDNVGKFTTVDLTGFVIGALALVSNKLKNNTDIDVVGFVVNQVAEALAQKLEKEFVNGTASKITGVISTTQGITAASATAITYDELVSAKHSLKRRYRKNAKWLMAPETYTALCKLKDSNGQPYFKEEEYKILNLPVIESDSMPAIAAGKKPIIVADFKGYTIKAASNIEVSILREKFATKNMLGIMAFCEFDGKITDAKRIKAITMANV